VTQCTQERQHDVGGFDLWTLIEVEVARVLLHERPHEVENVAVPRALEVARLRAVCVYQSIGTRLVVRLTVSELAFSSGFTSESQLCE